MRAAGGRKPGNSRLRRRLLLLTVCLGAFMGTLDTSIVNVALPQMARDFDCSLNRISWVILSYLLTNVSLLLASGRLGDLLAPGKLFSLGMFIFTGASALCGLSGSLAWLVASRALQGIGASVVLGLAPKLIAVAFGPGERGLALGLLSAAFAAGISIGAPLGGFITAHLGWPYIFFINVPICSLALISGSFSLWGIPAEGSGNLRAFDFWGALILAAGLGSLVLGLNGIQESGWRDGRVAASLLTATGLFIGLIFLERRQASPLLHPVLWLSRNFLVGSVAVLLAFAAVIGTFFLLPFFLEQVYHYTPDQTGLMLASLSVTNALVAPLGGRLADRLGNLLILRVGSGLMLLGLASLLFTRPEDSTLSLTVRFVVTGLGFGLFTAPNLNEILSGAPDALVGLAASTNAVLKNLGALLGITILVTVFARLKLHRVCPGPGACLEAAAFHYAFGVAAAMAGLNFLTNLLPRPQSFSGGNGRPY